MPKRPKMSIFGLKLAILDFKMAMELSKNIFIWTTAKSCTREYGIIHFITFFITFMWLRCQKGLKMAILGLKMALLDFKMGVELSKNILIWTTVKSCTKDYGINHFIIFFITFLRLKSQKSLKWLFLVWKWPFWISKWPWSSPKIFLSQPSDKLMNLGFIHFTTRCPCLIRNYDKLGWAGPHLISTRCFSFFHFPSFHFYFFTAELQSISMTGGRWVGGGWSSQTI